MSLDESIKMKYWPNWQIENIQQQNWVIRRHFGKQKRKEIKLRIYNSTAKAALKFGSEAWVLKKIVEQSLEAAQMKFWNICLE
jgi:hypothetical protein